MLIKFDRSFLLHKIISPKEKRAHFKGVQLDPDGWLIAGDGHVVAVVPCEIINPDFEKPRNIPVDVFAAAVRAKAPTKPARLELDEVGHWVAFETATLRVSDFNNETPLTAWRKLVERSNFNAEDQPQKFYALYNANQVKALSQALGEYPATVAIWQHPHNNQPSLVTPTVGVDSPQDRQPFGFIMGLVSDNLRIEGYAIEALGQGDRGHV